MDTTPTIQKIFVPARLFGGLAAFVGGGALAGVAAGAGLGIKLLGLGGVVAVAGAAIAATSKVEGCSRCKRAFEQTSTAFLHENKAQIVSAIGSAPNDAGAALLALGSAPFVPNTTRESTNVELEYCPTCEQVGRVCHSLRRILPDGATTSEHHAERVVLGGSSVKTILGMIAERNVAWTKVAYQG
jgi:hypothetical protein